MENDKQNEKFTWFSYMENEKQNIKMTLISYISDSCVHTVKNIELFIQREKGHSSPV